MTDAEYDDALDALAQGILQRLDNCPLRLGSDRRQHHDNLRVTIPISAVVTEADLVNAIHDVMRGLKLELTATEQLGAALAGISKAPDPVKPSKAVGWGNG